MISLAQVRVCVCACMCVDLCVCVKARGVTHVLQVDNMFGFIFTPIKTKYNKIHKPQKFNDHYI